jgi:hypothetical protein
MTEFSKLLSNKISSSLIPDAKGDWEDFTEDDLLKVLLDEEPKDKSTLH